MSLRPAMANIFAVNERDRTSPLFNPKVQGASVDLYVAYRQCRDLGPYLVRLSFLLSSIEWHFDSLMGLCHNLLKTGAPKPARSANGEPEHHFVMGRDLYPIFAVLNAMLTSAHSTMDYSIAFICFTLNIRNMHWSFHEANTASGARKLKKQVGEKVAEHIAEAWVWAKDLRDYRDTLSHFNPLITPVSIGFRSSDGKTYDGLELLLPRNPADKKTTDLGFDHSVETFQYCLETRDRIFRYIGGLLPLLVERAEPSINGGSAKA